MIPSFLTTEAYLLMCFGEKHQHNLFAKWHLTSMCFVSQIVEQQAIWRLTDFLIFIPCCTLLRWLLWHFVCSIICCLALSWNTRAYTAFLFLLLYGDPKSHPCPEPPELQLGTKACNVLLFFLCIFRPVYMRFLDMALWSQIHNST